MSLIVRTNAYNFNYKIYSLDKNIKKAFEKLTYIKTTN